MAEEIIDDLDELVKDFESALDIMIELIEDYDIDSNDMQSADKIREMRNKYFD